MGRMELVLATATLKRFGMMTPHLQMKALICLQPSSVANKSARMTVKTVIHIFSPPIGYETRVPGKVMVALLSLGLKPIPRIPILMASYHNLWDRIDMVMGRIITWEEIVNIVRGRRKKVGSILTSTEIQWKMSANSLAPISC